MNDSKTFAQTMGWPSISYSLQALSMVFIALASAEPYSNIAMMMAALSVLIAIINKGKTFLEIQLMFAKNTPRLGWSKRNEAIIVCLSLVVVTAILSGAPDVSNLFFAYASSIVAAVAGWAAMNDNSHMKKADAK